MQALANSSGKLKDERYKNALICPQYVLQYRQLKNPQSVPRLRVFLLKDVNLRQLTKKTPD